MQLSFRELALTITLSCSLTACSQINMGSAPTGTQTATTSGATTAATSPATTPPPPADASTPPPAAPQAADASQPPATDAAPAAAPTADAKTAASFTDISGLEAEEAIKDEANLGILDETSGTFKPFEPITRAQYVRWVVKANNKYSENPLTKLKLAEVPESAFVDVPTSHPDWKYIQGLANAGYVVGIDATHFAPDRPLTREEMVMIKAQLDEGCEIKPGKFDKRYVPYSDVDSINPDYIGAMYEDTCATTTNDCRRIWGSMKKFQPKKAVTRSEAAVSVSETRSGTLKKYLADSHS